MSYNILTETDFFKVIGHECAKAEEMNKVQEAYHKFVEMVIDLCHRTAENKEAIHALVFAETELQYHLLLRAESGCGICLYIRKALAFIRKMMQQVKMCAVNPSLVTPETSNGKQTADKATPICWTGNAVDLVEMVYGICVMGSVNDGEVKFKDLAQAMYQFSVSKPRTATASIPTSEGARTTAALTSLTRCRKS